jgi:hypothetical protein
MVPIVAPQPLVDDIECGRCLPFIGAGFSMNARLPPGDKMPGWAGLTAYLAKTVGALSDLGGPSVASKFEQQFGRVQLIEAIRKALHSGHAEPGKAHLAFADLPFDTIYTTNFDLLLEDAFQRLKKPFRSIVGELQMPFHGGRLTASIVKMHGDLRHEERITVTAEDYLRYVHDYPVIATHLAAQLITKTALFIGYSMTDPDFINIREIVRSRLGKFHRMAYILDFDAPSDDVSSKLKENLHVVSLSTLKNQDKDALLGDFFKNIQDRLDVEHAVKFRESRPDVFESIAPINLERASGEVDAPSLFTGSSNLCFVMMPIRPEFDSVYHTLIKPVTERFGLTVVRADEMYGAGPILEQIRVGIQQSRLCVADVTGRNPNVLYELGIAHTLNKPTVLLAQSTQDLVFDLSAFRTIVYNTEDLEGIRTKLSLSVEATLGEDRLEEARRLIGRKTYRSAAALLGVVLEHDLRRLIVGMLGTRMGNRPLSIAQSIRLLEDGGLIASGDSALLETAKQVRNRAVHALEEPSLEDVQMMLSTVQMFRKKYLDPR